MSPERGRADTARMATGRSFNEAGAQCPRKALRPSVGRAIYVRASMRPGRNVPGKAPLVCIICHIWVSLQ